ncbi:MAG: alpha/beta hydrolase, partial [Pseudomonadota bacterium]
NGVITLIKKAYVDTPAGQMHYRYCGPEDQPPVIFLHQNTSGSIMFQKTMEQLDGQLRCIAFDLPGFGESFEPPAFQSISELTAWTIAAIDALGIEKFHVLGNHTGAGMAAEMGALYPDRVLSVMMIGPLLLTPEQAEPFREQFSGSAGPDHDAEYLKVTWDYLYPLGGNLDIENMNNEFYSALRAWRSRGLIYECVWDYRFDEFIQALECPVLLMAAPDDVLHIAFENTRRALPNAHAVELKGANFEPNLDPEGTSSAVRNFLAAL